MPARLTEPEPAPTAPVTHQEIGPQSPTMSAARITPSVPVPSAPVPSAPVPVAPSPPSRIAALAIGAAAPARPLAALVPAARPAAVRVDARMARESAMAAPAPTIQVTIGRVEVRAVGAQGVAVRAPAKAESLSLEQFLARQSEQGTR